MILSQFNSNSVNIAIDFLKKGKVIAIPTDTVYGLACDAANDSAVRELYKIKNRLDSKPIAIFLKNIDLAQQFLVFNELSLKIAKSFFPGALTIILEKKQLSEEAKLSNLLNKNNSKIGLRIPNHQFCLDILDRFNGPLAVTSANPSSKDSATNSKEIKQYFGDEIDLVIDGDNCTKKASTVLEIINNQSFEILRQGIITKEEILMILK